MLDKENTHIYIPNKTVWDAILNFRNEILDNPHILLKTKDNHLCSLWKIISKNPKIIEQNLESFIKEDGKIFLETIQSSNWSEKTCQLRSDYVKHLLRIAKDKIHLHYAYEIPKEKEQISLENIKKMLSNSQTLLEIRKIPFEKLCHFFDYLRKINERDYLISKTIWFEQKTLEEALNTRIIDYITNNETEGNIAILLDIRPYLYKIIKNKIQKNDSKLEKILVAPPSGLTLILKELVKEDASIGELLIFQTRTGKHLSYTQPLRSMRAASKLAHIGLTITPKLLSIYAVNQDSYSQEAIDRFLLRGMCERMMESELKWLGLDIKDIKKVGELAKEVFKYMLFHVMQKKSPKMLNMTENQ